MTSYVLDTSALVTVFQEEPGVDLVVELLAKAREVRDGKEPTDPVRVHVPFMALMELDYLSRQRLGDREARRLCDLVKAWPVEVTESGEDWRREAARIKAAYPLSLADSWICGLATFLEAQLLHKDPEYDAVAGLRSLRLPYKAGTTPE